MHAPPPPPPLPQADARADFAPAAPGPVERPRVPPPPVTPPPPKPWVADLVTLPDFTFLADTIDSNLKQIWTPQVVQFSRLSPVMQESPTLLSDVFVREQEQELLDRVAIAYRYAAGAQAAEEAAAAARKDKGESRGGDDPMESWRALLICHFPREAAEEDVRTAFSVYGKVESVYLVVKGGVPKCYGFVNFGLHTNAEQALHACRNGQILFPDQRGSLWAIKAEWARSRGTASGSRRHMGGKPNPVKEKLRMPS